MSDSSDNNELFADSADEKSTGDVEGDAPPAYINEGEFLQFKDKE